MNSIVCHLASSIVSGSSVLHCVHQSVWFVHRSFTTKRTAAMSAGGGEGTLLAAGLVRSYRRAQQLICIGLEVFLTTSLNNQWVPSLLIPPPPRLAKAPFVLHPRRFPPPRHGPRILPDRDRMPWAIKGSTLHIRQLLVPFLPNLPPPRSSAPSRPAAAEIFWIVHSVQAGRVCSSLFTAMACGAGYLVLFN
jgi:hypothetical protein